MRINFSGNDRRPNQTHLFRDREHASKVFRYLRPQITTKREKPVRIAILGASDRSEAIDWVFSVARFLESTSKRKKQKPFPKTTRPFVRQAGKLMDITGVELDNQSPSIVYGQSKGLYWLVPRDIAAAKKAKGMRILLDNIKPASRKLLKALQKLGLPLIHPGPEWERMNTILTNLIQRRRGQFCLDDYHQLSKKYCLGISPKKYDTPHQLSPELHQAAGKHIQADMFDVVSRWQNLPDDQKPEIVSFKNVCQHMDPRDLAEIIHGLGQLPKGTKLVLGEMDFLSNMLKQQGDFALHNLLKRFGYAPAEKSPKLSEQFLLAAERDFSTPDIRVRPSETSLVWEKQ